MRANRFAAIAAVFTVSIVGGGTAFAQAGGGGGPPPGFRLAQLVVESTAFEDGGIVPDKYVARGGNVQPGFKFSNAPAETVSYAIIFHDLDVALGGGTDDVLHWFVWNIPAAAGGIPEGSLPAGAVTGKGLRGQTTYFGPGAPPGPRYHHYVFEFYALSANLALPDTAGRADLLAAMAGKVVAKAAYVGRYKGAAPAQ
jgi:Raf kinase inhibitor-like YbhB/YbcL family protein